MNKANIVKICIVVIFLIVLLYGMWALCKGRLTKTKCVGYIDITGKLVIRPQFEQARPFSNGRAAIISGGNMVSYINKVGQTIIEARDKSFYVPEAGIAVPYLFHEGLKNVRDTNGKYGFVNEAGDIAIQTHFEHALPFAEGFAAVEIDGKWGYIDKTGAVVIKPQFDYFAEEFSQGLASVQVGEKQGYIDTSGQMVIGPKFDLGGTFSEGLAAVQIGDKWGYINREGEVVIKPQFDNLFAPFRNGFAVVAIEDKWYVIDKLGSKVSEPIYHDIQSSFHDGLVLARNRNDEDGKYGYIDETGKVAIEMQFERAGLFSEGLAAVRVDGKWGYIDTTGKFVIKPKFWTAGDFSEGLAAVGVKDSE